MVSKADDGKQRNLQVKSIDIKINGNWHQDLLRQVLGIKDNILITLLTIVWDSLLFCYAVYFISFFSDNLDLWQPLLARDVNSQLLENPTRGRGTPSWRPPIRAAYTRTRFRGRGGRVAPVAYSHRTLVVNNNKPVSGSTSSTIATASPVSSFGTESINAALPSPTSVPVPGPSLPAQQKSTAWVAKRAPGAVQLINSSIFGQQAQAKAKERLRRREEKDKLKMKSWMQKSRGPTYGGLASNTNQTPYEVIISGERYRVAANGSKLEKISGEGKEQTLIGMEQNSVGFNWSATDDPKGAKSTPKKAVVGGVNFVRSKNGNLWRAGLVKASR